MITSLFPIMVTRDLGAALGFYRDLLGATVTYEFPGPDGTPVYVGLELGTSHFGIGLDTTDASPEAASSTSLWVYADDCAAAVERLRAAGITVVEEPTDQPW